MKKFNRRDYLIFVGCIGLAIYALHMGQDIQAQHQVYFPHPLSDDEIKKYGNNDKNAIVIYPIFTQYAYNKGGFYDYYNKTCDTCNIVSLNPLGIVPNYTQGMNSYLILQQLHYPIITDIEVDQHPEILKTYDKIILLHNEYVTQKEFDAIVQHKNVLYLYPNSLYVKIAVDYDKMIISLVRGHGYQDKSIMNGFNFVTTSKHEYDLNCQNYKWLEIPNGMQISCFPEFMIKADRSLLQTIKDYPNKIPILIPLSTEAINGSSLPNCNSWGYCPDNMPKT